MATLTHLQKTEIKVLESEIERRECLPHLFGHKHYKWSRAFFESTNQLNFLTAGNQLGKSSVMIRKCIHWATAPDLWPKLWKTKPRMFIYLYPSFQVGTREVEEKWVPTWLPRGKYINDPVFGYKIEYDKKEVKSIHFNSGIHVYLLAYAQSPSVLQASTVHAAFLDEEVPEEIWTELRFRLAAVSGYLHMGFTATLNQPMFAAVMEGKGRDELFPQAFKQQVSAFDCMHYEDGTPSHWTREKIEDLIASCPDQKEVDKRVYGKFVASDGLRYPSFSRAKNVKSNPKPPPDDWLIFAGVDIGSGANAKAHPSAITLVAVRPDFKFARVYCHWNGKGQITTSSDVLQKFIELRGNRRCVLQSFDYSSAEFGIIANRSGENFAKAKKDREFGDQTINSLFRNEMLVIDESDDALQLIRELERCNDRDRKTMALDDSVDSLRYCVASIPWDWQFLNPEPAAEEMAQPTTPDEKRLAAASKATRDWQQTPILDLNTTIDDELRFWSDMAELN